MDTQVDEVTFLGHTKSVRIQVSWLIIGYTFQCPLLLPWGGGQCFSPKVSNTKVVPWSCTVLHIFYRSIYIREKVPRWNFSFHSKFPDSWCFETDHGGKILEWSGERLININGSQVVAGPEILHVISSSRPIYVFNLSALIEMTCPL